MFFLPQIQFSALYVSAALVGIMAPASVWVVRERNKSTVPQSPSPLLLGATNDNGTTKINALLETNESKQTSHDASLRQPPYEFCSGAKIGTDEPTRIMEDDDLVLDFDKIGSTKKAASSPTPVPSPNPLRTVPTTTTSRVQDDSGLLFFLGQGIWQVMNDMNESEQAQDAVRGTAYRTFGFSFESMEQLLAWICSIQIWYGRAVWMFNVSMVMAIVYAIMRFIASFFYDSFGQDVKGDSASTSHRDATAAARTGTAAKNSALLSNAKELVDFLQACRTHLQRTGRPSRAASQACRNLHGHYNVTRYEYLTVTDLTFIARRLGCLRSGGIGTFATATNSTNKATLIVRVVTAYEMFLEGLNRSDLYDILQQHNIALGNPVVSKKDMIHRIVEAAF